MSPETNGENTLTTSFGWRLRRGVNEAGEPVPEWRCPGCWARFKAQHSSASDIGPPPTPGRDPRHGKG